MAAAETLRVATWHVELMRNGPGLLVRDISKGDPQVKAVVRVTAHVAPDILVLTGVDWDQGAVALGLLAEKLGFPHSFTARPNSGLMTDLDLDLDGRLGGAADAQGFGRFLGNGGMAVLSQYPIHLKHDFTDMLWADVPGALLYEGMAPEVAERQRLSSSNHWDLEINGLRFLAFAAGPPVFDGAEDRNGRRNHDEIAIWMPYLDQIDGPVVVIGNGNLDPVDGEGRHGAISKLLSHPRLQDPQPRSSGAVVATNPEHRGDPGLDTVDWNDPSPGNLRVSYVLPDRRLHILDAGVFWPAPDAPDYALLLDGPRHKLVWVDLEF